MQVKDSPDQQQNNPLPTEFITRLQELIPEATCILLFGSVASGQADSASDHDLLILTNSPVERERKNQVKSQLSKEFDQLKLDLIINSESALVASLPYEPSRRFWLENAQLLFGHWPVISSYPALARGALLSHLNIIAAEIDLGSSEESLIDQARVGLDALEHLLHIKLALVDEYHNQAVRDEIEALLSVDALRTIRLKPAKITASMTSHLYATLEQLHAQLMESVNALPENKIDQMWIASWRESDESTKTVAVGGSVDR